MELLEARPKVLKSVGFPWKPMKIVPLGDLQVGSEGFGDSRFKRFMDEALRQDAYFIGMGDYSDFLSPSNRTKLKNAGLYDTAQGLIEEWHMAQLDKIKELLRPTKGRWLGLLQGHHYYEFDPSTTTDTELARFLEAPFLGDCAMMRVSFTQPSGKGKPRVQSSTIWAHHGAGSGVSAASALTKLERYAGYVDADVMMMGHQSKRGYLPKPRIGLSRNIRRGIPELVSKTQHLVSTGSWLEGYKVGSAPFRGRPQGSYVEKAMMVPVSLGGMVVTLIPTHEGVNVRVEGGDD